MTQQLQQIIETAWDNRAELSAASAPKEVVEAVEFALQQLDNGTLRCVQDDDGVNEIIAKCIEADGIVLASPVYHGGIAGGMKCVLDRLILAAGCGDNQLKHKVGAALCTLRRSGGMETYQQLLGTINTMEMVLVTSDYWNAVHGADKGEAMQDIEGVEVIEKLGRAWSSIYESLADMSVEYYPLGELGVLQNGQITNSDHVAAWLGTAIS